MCTWNCVHIILANYPSLYNYMYLVIEKGLGIAVGMLLGIAVVVGWVLAVGKVREAAADKVHKAAADRQFAGAVVPGVPAGMEHGVDMFAADPVQQEVAVLEVQDHVHSRTHKQENFKQMLEQSWQVFAQFLYNTRGHLYLEILCVALL